MNWATVNKVAENPGKQLYFNQKEVAQMLGCDRHLAAEFLIQSGVAYYRIGKEKKYFLYEVLEAIQKTRWKD